jgi:Tetratricopeptide repeat
MSPVCSPDDRFSAHYTALSLRNLAVLLEAEGDLTGARLLYERTLAIYEKALGPEHPNATSVRDHLNLCFRH